jgi:colicin import membrane protein
MESFADKARACVYALLVHLLCMALFFGGLLWTERTRPVSLSGPVIEAELVGLAAVPKARTVRTKPAPKPVEAAAKPPPAPPPSEPQHEDRIEREKVAELARQQAEAAERAQEERHRQEQALLEQEQRELRQLEEVRRQREAAERRLKLEKEKLAQLDDLKKKAKPVPPPPQPVAEAPTATSGTNGREDSLQAQYFAAIQNAVTLNWLRPESTPPGLRCMLHIVQIPGGDVIGVQVINPCNADPLTRNSIEQAVKRASPLPYKGYEKAFTRDLNFNFTYDG